jgi:predicted phosphodiesterase
MQAVIEDVKQQIVERPIDLIIFSGDLTWSGDDVEFALAQELLLDPLEALTGCSHEQIVFVPGNHDVKRALIDEYAETGWAQATETRDGVIGLMENEQALERATARLAGWQAFVKAYYEDADVAPVGTLARTHRLEIRGITVGIAALNSAWRASGLLDKGRLLIGERQLLPALEAIDDVDMPLVAVHHPLDWLAPFDLDATRAEFAGRGVMVLSGHEHLSEPMSVNTAGGQVVYSRAGSLFSSLGYNNGYSLVDVAPRDGRSDFVLRTWWPDRREWDEGSDRAHRGRAQLSWPSASRGELGVRLRYSTVVATLSDAIQVRSVLADRLVGEIPFDELIVPPRFLPSRYGEASAAISVDPDKRLNRVDPVGQLSEKRVVIIAGEPEAGVSTSLYWILKQYFDRDTLRAPVLMRFDHRFDRRLLERSAVRSLRAYGVDVSRANLPALLVALDDVRPEQTGALDRLTGVIVERAADFFALGCADEDYESLAKALDEAGIAYSTAFVAPFGRRELRDLLERASQEGALLDRVMTIVGREGLPRSPFVLSALVAVLAEQSDASSLNESGVLGGYVDLLLSDALVDLERVGMDKRRREYLLARLAVRLTESESGTLTRLDVEEYLAGYFRAQGWLTASPGRVIDSLITRRILTSDDDLIGFRHPALFSFFKGAAYGDDGEFAARLRSDPLGNAAALRHAAGLRRNDSELLTFTMDFVEGRIRDAGGPQSERYAPRLLLDPSSTLELELDTAVPTFTEREWDEHADHLADMRAGSPRVETPENRDGREISRCASLLSQVLRNTELSTELELKQRALRTATTAWVATGARILVHLAQAGAAREMLGRFGINQGELESSEAETLLPLLDEFIRRMVIVMLAAGMADQIASRHMEAVVQEAIADAELMSDPVTAFLLTLLYTRLGLRDWPEKLLDVYQRHRGDAMVAEGLRGWAFYQYRTTPDEGEAHRLEATLVAIYEPIGVGRGGTAVVTRGIAKDQTLQKLRSQRAASSHARSTIESKLDPLDIEEESASPQ